MEPSGALVNKFFCNGVISRGRTFERVETTVRPAALFPTPLGVTDSEEFDSKQAKLKKIS